MYWHHRIKFENWPWCCCHAFFKNNEGEDASVRTTQNAGAGGTQNNSARRGKLNDARMLKWQTDVQKC